MAKNSIITAVKEDAFAIETLNSFAKRGCNGWVAYITDNKIVIVYTITISLFFLVNYIAAPDADMISFASSLILDGSHMGSNTK